MESKATRVSKSNGFPIDLRQELTSHFLNQRLLYIISRPCRKATFTR
jgi:hypothetical protein